MPESIKPRPMKVVTQNSVQPAPATARRWGGFTKMGLGDVQAIAIRADGRSQAITRPGVGRIQVAGLTTRRTSFPRFEAADPPSAIVEIWQSFPWWWASVILASGFAFALGATLSVLLTR